MRKYQKTNARGPISSPPFSDPGSYPGWHSSSCHLVRASTTHNPQAPASWALNIPWGPFLSKVDPHHHSEFVVYKALLDLSPHFICPSPQRCAAASSYGLGRDNCVHLFPTPCSAKSVQLGRGGRIFPQKLANTINYKSEPPFFSSPFFRGEN